MDIVRQNKTCRFTLLFSLYITVNGYYEIVKDLSMLAEHNGLGPKVFKAAFIYLREERLIIPKEGDNEYLAALSHKGIKAVEEVFTDVNIPTYYFPAYRDMQG